MIEENVLDLLEIDYEQYGFFPPIIQIVNSENLLEILKTKISDGNKRLLTNEECEYCLKIIDVIKKTNSNLDNILKCARLYFNIRAGNANLITSDECIEILKFIDLKFIKNETTKTIHK